MTWGTSVPQVSCPLKMQEGYVNEIIFGPQILPNTGQTVINNPDDVLVLET